MNENLLYMGNDETLKWMYNGKSYCLHIQRDDRCEDPRTQDDAETLLTTMACWHGQYTLGDSAATKGYTPEEFWQKLVRENVDPSEIYMTAAARQLPGIRVSPNKENSKLVDIYETTQLQTPLGDSDPSEDLEYEGVPQTAVSEYLIDDLTIHHCMILMQPYAEWLPIWLYDHSGITVSCGERTGQYADRWDSGQLGFIIMLKETAMKELVEFLLDEKGNPIRTKYPNGSMGYVTRPLTEDTWRPRAIEVMKQDVLSYDQFLTDNVYGFTLYEADPVEKDESPDWIEVDSCWGFYGSELHSNGILDHIGSEYGLQEVLASKDYEYGMAEKRVVVCYDF
ncbi:MAG: hypothetical protein NC548_53875 [Lachnospiraceae bacterium]|nr:hypothetical protein [Lachnospiraceae bacterium]